MKNSQMYLKTVIAVIALFTVSCTDLVTKEVDSQVVKSGSGAGAAADLGGLLTNSYKDLGGFTDQAAVYSLYEHVTDELKPPTRGVDWGDNGVWRTLYQHTWDPSHANILGAWNNLNSNVYRTNQVIQSTNPVPSAGQLAEAKVLRALNMWFAMDLWGQVPFRNITDGATVLPKVYSRSEAFDFILKDLQDALPGLDNGSPANVNEKATKAVAQFLIARMMLNKAVYKSATPAGPYTFAASDMDAVIAAVDAIDSYGFGLEPNFFDNFNKTGTKERLLTVRGDAGTSQNRYYMTLHYDQNPSGWNGFTTLADFYGKFDAADKRIGAPSPVGVGSAFYGIKLGFLKGPQVKDDGSPLVDSRTQKVLDFSSDVPLSGAATEKGIRAIKYHPANSGTYIMFRYADAYLMRAEANFRKGNVAAATTALTNLRAVRGAGALTATLDNILDERGRELYWEGVRRIDLIRFGKFTATHDDKTVSDPNRVLYCIPQLALDSNPNLKQNPGYGGN